MTGHRPRTVNHKVKDPTRFRCVVCGKVTAGRRPRNPHNHRERADGTAMFPRWHYVGGKPCEGNYSEAEWVIASS